MKTISILLAMLNALVAGLILAYSLSRSEWGESGALWSLTKAAAAVFVIAAAALTWLDGAKPRPGYLMLTAGLSLVALGAALFVWTVHLELVTGDLEAYMLLYGGSLMLQGAASVMGFQPEPHRALVS